MCALLTDDSLSLSLQQFLAFNAFVMMARGKKKEKKTVCVKTLLSPQPTQHTAHSPHTSWWLFLPTSVSAVDITSLFFIWSMRWHICPLPQLSPSPWVSVGTWKAAWRASAKPPNLSHFILSWGNLPGSEKGELICVWNANVNSLSPTLWMRAPRPSPCCKTHLLCVF